MVAGAIVAGYESLDANGIGYIYVWMTNFTQAFQNVFTSKYIPSAAAQSVGGVPSDTGSK